MTHIMYVGPFEAVDVEHQAGRVFAFTAYRGNPVDVPADIAAALLEQPSNWRQVVKKQVSNIGADAAPIKGDDKP